MSSGGDNIILSSTQAVATSSAANVSLMKLGTLTQTIIGIVLTGAVIGATVTTVALISVRVGVSAPIAENDFAKAYKTIETTIYPLVNDRDSRGANLTIQSITQPLFGKANIVNNGKAVKYQSFMYYAGIDSFNYTIYNGKLTAQATVFINVLNLDPQAPDFSFSVAKNSIDNTFDMFNIVQNQLRISDLDNDLMHISDVSSPEFGTAVTNGTHIFYTPIPDSRASDLFQYNVTDRNTTATGTISINVINNRPVANPDSIVSPKNKVLVIDVLENDFDENADNITVISLGNSLAVQFINSDNTITYLPRAITDPVTDSFEYTISDGEETATSYVTIRMVNTPPVVFNTTLTVVKNTVDNRATIGMNDEDILDSLTANLNPEVTQHGSLHLEKSTAVQNVFFADNWYTIQDNTFTILYTPRKDAVESDLVEFIVTDGYDQAVGHVQVTIINQPPVANEDQVECSKNLPALFNLLANDEDPNGDKIKLVSFTSYATELQGTVERVNDTHVLYTPPQGVYPGMDSFKYDITDIQERSVNDLTASATVFITIINDNPIAVDDTATVGRNLAVDIDVLANDSDPNGDAVTVITLGDVSSENNTATIIEDGKKVHFTASNNLETVEFTYTIQDVDDGQAQATVKVSVVNNKPVPADDSYSTLWNRVTSFDVIDNDSDINGDSLSIFSYTSPSKGSLTKKNDREFTYTPDRGFVGSDSFTYTVYDGFDESETSATVNIQVTNVAPVAEPDTESTHWAQSVVIAALDNDSDVDGDVLTISAVYQPEHGSASIVTLESGADGIKYTPTQHIGDVTFTYTVTDGNKYANSTVTVSVENQAPVATDDSVTLHWQSQEITVEVLDNDSDPDGDSITIDRYELPTGFQGELSISSDKTSLLYRPTGNFVGSQDVVYYITDGPSNTANAVLTIVQTNDIKPQPESKEFTVHWSTQTTGTSFPIFASSTPTDDEGDALTYQVTQPTSGTVTNETSTDISLRYVQNHNFLGVDTFSYTVFDGIDSAAVSVKFTVVNSKPTASDFSSVGHWKLFSTNGVTVDAITAANATDADSQDTVSLKSVSPSGTIAGKGQVTVAASSITFKPVTGFVGTVVLTVVFTDGIEDTSVSYTITVENIAPVATPVSSNAHWRTLLSGKTVDVLGDIIDADSDVVTFSVTNTVNATYSVQAGKVVLKQTTTKLGTASVTVSYTDGWQSASATWTVAVYNNVPTAEDKSYTTHWRVTEVSFAVLTNSADTDTEDAVTLQSVDNTGSQGVASVSGSQVKYVPKANYVGPDSFKFTVTDGLATVTKTATISVTNTKPVPQNDAVSIPWSQASVDIPVLANDNDANNDPISVDTFTNPTTGTVEKSATGIRYTVKTPYTSTSIGTFPFTYKITDAAEQSASSATVTVTVTNTNKPTATDFSRTVHWTEFSDISFSITQTKTDNDGDTYAVSQVSNPVGFTFTLDNTASGLTYLVNAPNASWKNGTGSITYRLTDGIESATGTIALNVYNNVPTAADFALDLHWSLLQQGTTFNVLAKATDADPQDVLSIASIDTSLLPNGAVAEIRTDASSGQKVIFYKPAPEVRGSDIVRYTVTDGLHSATATINVTVSSVTVSPTDQFYPLHWATTPKVLTLIANLDGTEAEKANLIIDDDVIQQPNKGGSFSISSDKKTVTYQQATSYLGEEVFKVGYKDGEFGTVVPITVTVSITNTPPTVQSRTINLHRLAVVSGYPVNVATGSSDAESDTLTVTAVTKLAGSGAATWTSGNSFTYSPSAASFVGDGERFQFTISDGVQSTSGTIVINVANNPPVTYQKELTTHWTNLLNAENFIIDVLDGSYPGGTASANADKDNDAGDTLTVSNVSGSLLGSSATVTWTSGSQVKFALASPNPVVNSPLTFTYTVTDGASNGAITQRVLVTAQNAAPVANPDTKTIHWKETGVTLDVLANDSDADGDSLTIKSATSSQQGTVQVAGGAGSLTYTPKALFAGNDIITYKITDGASEATGSMNVTVYNTKPVANPISRTYKWSDIPVAGVTIAVIDTASAFDADTADTLTMSVSGVQQGMSVSVSGKNIVFKPSQGFTGATTFTYTVTDGMLSTSAQVSITVTNTAPTATTATFTRHWRTTTGTFNLASYFTDANNDPIVISSVSTPISGGSVSVNGLVVTYTQPVRYTGNDKFTVSYSDTWSAVKTVDFQVQVFNTAPTVYAITLPSSHPTTFNVPILTRTDSLKAKDNDADDTQYLAVVNTFSGTYPDGTSITTDGSKVTITPVAGSLSTITVRYGVTDGLATSYENIVIALSNAAPNVQAFQQSVHWRAASAGLSFNVLTGASDSDGDSLSVVSVTGSQGSVSTVGSTATVVPPSTTGVYTWTFVVTDSYVQVSGTITVTVQNAVPVATSFAVSKRWTESTFSIPITGRVTDGDTNDANFLQYSDVSSPFATLAADGKSIQFSKTLTATDIGVSFPITYRGFDGLSKSTQQTITVTFTNEAPVATSYSSTIKWSQVAQFDLIAQCSDATDSVSITRINGVALASISSLNTDSSAQASIKGKLTMTDAGRVTIKYEPTLAMPYTQSTAAKSATSTWTFTCSDGLMTTDGSVTITVTNTQPSAADASYTFTRVASKTQYVISNFFATGQVDPADNDPISLTNVVGATVSGSDIVLNVDSTTTSRSFTYQVTDGQLLSRVATVNVAISNSAPVCTPQSVTINKGATSTFAVSALCSDENGDSFSFSAATVQTGSVSFSGTTITYTAPTDTSGTFIINYNARDSPLGATSATAQITVNVVNRAPSLSPATWNIAARRDSTQATWGLSSLLTATSATDQDSYDASRLTVQSVSATTCGTSSHGTLSVSGGNVVFNRVMTFSSGSCKFNLVIVDADTVNPRTAQAEITISVTTSGLNAVGKTISVVDKDGVFQLAPTEITSNDVDPLGGTFTFETWLFDTCDQVGFCRAGTTPSQVGNKWQFTSKSLNCQIDRYKYRIRSVQDPTISATAILNVQYTNCVCNVPIDVAIIFDASGSVGATNFQKMKDFAVSLVNNFNFADSTSDTSKNARMGVIRFSDSDKINEIQSMSNSKTTVANAIAGMTYPGGGTWILDAVRRGETMLRQQGRASVVNKVMLVLFDGEPNGPCSCSSCRSSYSSVSGSVAQENMCKSQRFPWRTCNPCDVNYNVDLKCMPCSDVVPLCNTINNRKPDVYGNTADGYWRVIPIGIGQALSNAVAQQMLKDMSYDPNRSFYVDWDQLASLYQTVSDQTCNLVDIGSGTTEVTVVEPDEPDTFKCGDIITAYGAQGYLSYLTYGTYTNSLMANQTYHPNTSGKARDGLWQIVCPGKSSGTLITYGTTVALWNLQLRLYAKRLATSSSSTNDIYVTVSGTQNEFNSNTAALIFNTVTSGFTTSGKHYHGNSVCLSSTTRTSHLAMNPGTNNDKSEKQAIVNQSSCSSSTQFLFMKVVPWNTIKNLAFSPALSVGDLPVAPATTD